MSFEIQVGFRNIRVGWSILAILRSGSRSIFKVVTGGLYVI